MRVAAGLLLVAAVAGCDPYERRSGEYYAGAVDPRRFPRRISAPAGIPSAAAG